jgi:hypothetical protein
MGGVHVVRFPGAGALERDDFCSFLWGLVDLHKAHVLFVGVLVV